jgi:GH24 family phage-related lysozyme (muramidase)
MDIRQGAIDRTASFEAFVGYMYLDTNAYVTVGYGRMLPNADSATGVPFMLNGAPASDQQKRDEWTNMHGQDPGHVASYYQQFTTLTLDESDAKSLLKDDLTVAASNLQIRFPALDSYPDPAQDALLDMIFNIGLTKFTGDDWPSLFAAVKSQDWKTAAAQSHRTDVPDARNNAIRDLFLSAVPKVVEVAHATKAQQIVAQHLLDLLTFIKAGQESPKFYPNGITKVLLSVKIAGTEIRLDIEGPSDV